MYQSQFSPTNSAAESRHPWYFRWMLRSPLCNQARWVACALCSFALTGCPQLERDDFRIGGGSPPDGTGGFENVGGAAGSSSIGALCRPGAFGIAEIITGLSVTGQLWSPSLSADGSTLFFEGVENNNHRVYAASRADRGPAFLQAKVVSIEGAPSIQASPFLSADDKFLYFISSSTNGSTDRDIWVASRTDTTIPAFSGAQVIASVNSAAAENRPWISPDQLTLLFASARTGGLGDNDIWMATRGSVSSLQFNVLPNLTTLNSRYRDGSAILSRDGLTAYFSSTRGSFGAGKQDIWTATRASTNSTNFGTLSPLAAVNDTNSEETDPALSQDETELFFVSDRSITSQIWRTVRSCTPN
jgi:Tol biopolymer transport system component